MKCAKIWHFTNLGGRTNSTSRWSSEHSELLLYSTVHFIYWYLIKHKNNLNSTHTNTEACCSVRKFAQSVACRRK